MNLKYLKLSLIIMTFSLVIFACGKKGGSANHVQIPDDMHYVVSINSKSLQNKVKDIAQVFDNNFLKNVDISEKDAKEMKEIGDALLKSGIDLNEKAYVFGKIEENMDNVFVGLSFILKDAKSFETSIQKAFKKDFVVKEESGIKFGKPKKNDIRESVIAWKGKTALFLMMKKGDVMKFAKEIFATKSNKSIFTKYKEAAEMEAKNYDFGTWIDYVQVNKVIKKANKDRMEDIYNLPEMDKFLEVTTSLTAGLSFENGEVKLDSEVSLDPSKSKLYESMLKSGIAQNVIKNIPIQAPQVMAGFGFALRPLYDLVKNSKSIKEEEKNTKKAIGLSNDELIDMLSGDFLIALKNLKVGDAIGGNPDPEAVVAVGVAKKDLFEKMMKNGEAFKDFTKEGDYYVYAPMPNVSVFLVFKDNGLYVVGSKSLRDAILKGSGKVDGEHLALTKNNSSLMYLDFKFFEQLMSFIGKNKPLEITLKELKNLTIESSTVKNHKLTAKGSLKMTNTKDNSLLVLVNMIKEIAAEEAKERKKRLEEEPKEEGTDEKPVEEEKVEEPKESL